MRKGKEIIQRSNSCTSFLTKCIKYKLTVYFEHQSSFDSEILYISFKY